MSLESTYRSLQEELNQYGASLIAVSKTKSPEEIMKLYELGHRDFGENRARELQKKVGLLPEDIRWHMIGTLQSNKVKYIAPIVHMVQSVDRKKIIRYLEKEAVAADRTIDILLQLRIAREESKDGFPAEEVKELFRSGNFRNYKHLRFRGLMGMATLTDDMEVVRSEFKSLAQLFREIREKFQPGEDFDQLSMGMSGDYKVALEEGATMVRIGSMIFGARETT